MSTGAGIAHALTAVPVSSIHVPAAARRHLLRAHDLADVHYAEPLTVPDMAGAARLSAACFSRELGRVFGESAPSIC
jgi:AraC-like DNA-binding protein